MPAQTTILDPAASAARTAVRGNKGPGDLRGRTVAFVDNAKPNFNFLADDLAEILVNEHGVAKVIRHRKNAASNPASTDIYDDIQRQGSDLVITGSGD